MLSIGVEKPPNHTLVLRVVLSRLVLEELHATLTQRDSNFDALFPENQVFRSRQEITNDLEVAERLVCVPDFLAHKFASLCASNQPRGLAHRATMNDLRR